MQERIAGIVVLYHPDMAALAQMVQVMRPQLALLYLVDNTDDGTAGIEALLGEGVRHLPMQGNQGIAAAQNAGIRQAQRDGCSHVLLLDQDSCLPDDLLPGLLAAQRALQAAGQPVAAVGPAYRDRKSGRLSPAIWSDWLRMRSHYPQPGDTAPMRSQFLIASGSLLELATLQRIGLLDEQLFIDWVDIEWGQRAWRMGYPCWLIPTVMMDHSIGDRSATFLGRSFNIHSDFRNYFILRNGVYLCLRGRLRPVPGTLAITGLRCLLNWWHSGRRMGFLGLMLRALLDGVRGHMGKGYFAR